MSKQDIIDEMRVLPVIDPDFEITRRVAFIQNQLTNAGAKTLVLGISGGVDSSTCGRLAQLAVDGLNQQHNCTDYRFAAVRSALWHPKRRRRCTGVSSLYPTQPKPHGEYQRRC